MPVPPPGYDDSWNPTQANYENVGMQSYAGLVVLGVFFTAVGIAAFWPVGVPLAVIEAEVAGGAGGIMYAGYRWFNVPLNLISQINAANIGELTAEEIYALNIALIRADMAVEGFSSTGLPITMWEYINSFQALYLFAILDQFGNAQNFDNYLNRPIDPGIITIGDCYTDPGVVGENEYCPN